MINQVWFTKNLRIADSVERDLPELGGVMLSNMDTFQMDGIAAPDVGELERWMREGDLPPGGVRENYRLQTISRRDNGDVVGYLGLYYGYPDSRTLYVSSLFIGREYQGRRYGGEVAEGLRTAAGLEEFPVHRLVVTVRNWAAVRFWVRHGFSQVVKVIGELEGEGEVARLELVRERSSGAR